MCRQCRAGNTIDEGSSRNGFNVLLDLIQDAFLVELVLLNTAGVSQPRRIEGANLEKTLRVLIISAKAVTYHYAAAACKSLSAGPVGLTLMEDRTTRSLVGSKMAKP